VNALVVGCGSIGSRHARNLRSLGATVTVFDPDGARAAGVGEEARVQVASSLDSALEGRPHLVLVCTPPHLHVTTAAQALDANAHLFIEKPISHSLDGVDDLLAAGASRGRKVYVGYSLRFHAGLRKMKELIDEGAIGRPLLVRAEAGQYLPTWRPAQDYRTGYIVSHDTGGGMILDGSHEIDYVRWLGGELNRVYCAAAHVSDLEMETEDSAAITLRFESGGLGEIHLDCVQRGYARNCKVVGDEGTLIWDYPRGVTWIRADGTPQEFPIAPEPNEMYLNQMTHVLAVVAGEESPVVNGETGRRVLEIALAAKRSAQLGKEIDV
jgi:predicted dehydrogenase